jgi:uncharacterized membrane protein HdeD (DUF308 family)
MATSSHSHTMIGFEVLMLVPETVSVLLARGALAVVFGLVALIWPIGTAVGLAVLFGVYAFVDGGLIIAAFRGHGRSSRWANALSGLASLVMAVLAVTWPGMTG